jgi:uncharacterized protein YqhQ
MSTTDPSDRRPERPRSEPEIIPPGRRGARDEFSSVFISVDERDGVRRVTIKHPGPFAIVLSLLALGLIIAVIFLLLAGIVLVWVPIVVAGLLLALIVGAVRYHWWRLKAWWAG